MASYLVALVSIGVNVEEHWCLGKRECAIQEEDSFVSLDERLGIVVKVSDIDNASCADECFREVHLINHEDALSTVCAINRVAADLPSEPCIV
jgi:hypothetical protein